MVRAFLVLVLVALVAGAYVVLTPFGPSTAVLVTIAPGTGTAAMAAELERAGVVRSRYAFELLRRLKGGTLKAGVYRFDHAVPASEVYARIRQGDVYTRTLVIPEGFNVYGIAAAVQAAGLGDASTFLTAEQTEGALVHAWSPEAVSTEGYLFPDTYRFSPGTTPVAMLTAMVRRFSVQAAKLGLEPRSVNARGETAADIVTLASLVEREVHVDAERPVVAGVFENRLRAGMPLQTDPAVVYASLLRGTWTGVIHQSELHSDSAYNTYAHTGLPPGPICNPGMAALRAAMSPAATPYLYFVAKADGTTVFATTIAEHEANVAAMREGR